MMHIIMHNDQNKGETKKRKLSKKHINFAEIVGGKFINFAEMKNYLKVLWK